MALRYHPKPGEIVICDYRGFIVPEMVKRRLVVVLSSRLRRRDGLCTVIPLSATRPDPVEDYHCQVELDRKLPPPFDANPMWGKCDMLATVCFYRLELVSIGKDQFGKRKYIQPVIDSDTLKKVKACVLKSLGVSID